MCTCTCCWGEAGCLRGEISAEGVRGAEKEDCSARAVAGEGTEEPVGVGEREEGGDGVRVDLSTMGEATE